MGFRERAATWLGTLIKQFMTPAILMPMLASVSTVIAYYAHKQVPAFWGVALTGIAVFITMQYYRWKERKRLSEKPLDAETFQLGIKWRYQTKVGIPTPEPPVPLCPECGIELLLPGNLSNPIGGPVAHPGYIACDRDGCGFKVPTSMYRNQLIKHISRLIAAEHRAMDEPK